MDVCVCVCVQVLDALIDGTSLQEDMDDRDVESRAMCVRALGSVCSTLFSTTSPAFSSTPSSPDALSLLLNKVCVLQGIFETCACML